MLNCGWRKVDGPGAEIVYVDQIALHDGGMWQVDILQDATEGRYIYKFWDVLEVRVIDEYFGFPEWDHPVFKGCAVARSNVSEDISRFLENSGVPPDGPTLWHYRLCSETYIVNILTRADIEICLEGDWRYS